MKKQDTNKKQVIKINNQFVAKVNINSLMMCDHVKDAQDISGFSWEMISHIMSCLKQNKDVTNYEIVEVKK